MQPWRTFLKQKSSNIRHLAALFLPLNYIIHACNKWFIFKIKPPETINNISNVSVFAPILSSAPKPLLSSKLWMNVLRNMLTVCHECAASYIKCDLFLIATEIRWNRPNGYFIVMNTSPGCFQAPVSECRDMFILTVHLYKYCHNY